MSARSGLRKWRPGGTAVLAGALVLVGATAPDASAQAVGRAAAEALEVPPLRFDPPEPELHEVRGVPVLFLADPGLPLVSVFARFQGGYGRLGREAYAAGTALPTLLRYGGTTTLAPDSLDALLEYFAIQTSFGGGGESVFASVNTLTEHLDTALTLWGSMMREPGWDARQLEVWRGSEVERVRRRGDDPARLAYSEFNRLLYGDHPVGWEMSLDDLRPDDVSAARMASVHGRIVCPGNLTLGATGDVTWEDIAPLLDRMLAEWPACGEPLPPSPEPRILRQPGVWIIPRDLEQSVIVMAHPTDVHLADEPEYYAAQIGNSILGGGGFSSRILSRVRTEEGYAYSASSLWTTPRRFDGIVGAITRTRPENTVPAIRLILEILDDARHTPPDDEEVGTAVDQIVNGFVFNFDSPGQIVARRMFYLAQDLPADWLERYLAGVQAVTPESIRSVFADHLRPDGMSILIVGDPDRIGADDLASLGPVTVLDVDGTPAGSR
ncbi:MAG: pitrilysin family protein [Longimicrobiales bacterium]